MRVEINEPECIGCGLCPQISEEVFRMSGGLAEVIIEDVPESEENSVQEAADSCPTEAIIVS